MSDALPSDAVARAVCARLPGRAVHAVRDRGEWARRIFEVTLDGGDTVYVKLSTHPEWLLGAVHEAPVARILAEHGLPAPRVLAVDCTRELLPHPYVIVERQPGGARLGDLLAQVDETNALAIYRALGRFYRRLHAICGPRSGVWLEDPTQTLSISPNDYMFQAEVVEGCGRRAVAEERLALSTHERIIGLWRERMGYLKEHQPVLVHGSPFGWTIYLEKGEDEWHVAKITSLGDVLWWDAAYDLAFLLYPPFVSITPARREAFLETYGLAPDEQRILLYLLMQRLCASCGAYMEPRTPQTQAWTERCLDDLDALMDRIENSNGDRSIGG